MHGQIVIQERFRGPPTSGNGGYSCGLVARAIGDAAQVNLRKPPPLETPLTLEVDGASARLLDDEDVVADGARHDVQESVPASSQMAEARDGMANFAGFHEHPFPGCFVCGPGVRRETACTSSPARWTDAAWSPRRGSRIARFAGTRLGMSRRRSCGRCSTARPASGSALLGSAGAIGAGAAGGPARRRPWSRSGHTS